MCNTNKLKDVQTHLKDVQTHVLWGGLPSQIMLRAPLRLGPALSVGISVETSNLDKSEENGWIEGYNCVDLICTEKKHTVTVAMCAHTARSEGQQILV